MDPNYLTFLITQIASNSCHLFFSLNNSEFLTNILTQCRRQPDVKAWWPPSVPQVDRTFTWNLTQCHWGADTRIWQENGRVLTPLLIPSLTKRVVKVAAFSTNLLPKIFILRSHYSSREERTSLSSKTKTPSRLRVSVPYY